MEYILINKSETIQNQFVSPYLLDVEKEFFGRLTHDLELLKLYNISDFNKVYDNYIIYKFSKSPQTNFFQIIETYKFESSINKFKCIKQKIEPSIISQALTHADIILNKKTEDIQLFDITCKKQINPKIDFDLNKNQPIEDDYNIVDNDPDVVSYSEDTDTDMDSDIDVIENDDTIELHTVKEKMKQLQELQAAKKARIKEFEKNHIKARKKQANELCEISLIKKKEQYEKEKLEANKRKFNVDKTVYEKIKEDVINGKLNENNISPFFINTYKVLKEMDASNTLQNPEAYSIFILSYTELINKLKDTIKEEDDPYGIFS